MSSSELRTQKLHYLKSHANMMGDKVKSYSGGREGGSFRRHRGEESREMER